MSNADDICKLLTEIRDLLKGDNSNTQQESSSNNAASTCNKCGGEIRWKKSRKGKFYPVDVDGTFHSETCTGERKENIKPPSESDGGIPF